MKDQEELNNSKGSNESSGSGNGSPIKQDDPIKKKLKKLRKTKNMSPIAVKVINEVLQTLDEKDDEIKFLKRDLSKSEAKILALEDKIETKIALIQQEKGQKQLLEVRVQVYELFLGSRQRLEEVCRKVIPYFIEANDSLSRKQKMFVSFDLRITRMSRIILERLTRNTTSQAILSIADFLNGQEKLYSTFSNPVRNGIKAKIPSSDEEWENIFEIASAADTEEKISLKISLPGTTEEEVFKHSVAFPGSCFCVHVRNISKTVDLSKINQYLSEDTFKDLKLRKCLVWDAHGKFAGELYLYIENTNMTETDLFNLLKNEKIDEKAVFITTIQINPLLM